MSRSRQLAAIMFTDIKGYTALMQQNEAKAIQARNKHRQIFNTTTEKFNGKILQYYGDGTLSIFDSAIDAVHCAIEMQLGFLENPPIPVRIGIHTGDIFFSDEEIVGDSVNVASRIESLAVPGSIFISEKVHDEIKNQESIQTRRIKTFRLKNIAKPIEVYAISNSGLVVPDPKDIQGKTEPEPSKPAQQSQQEASIQSLSVPFLATKLFIPPPRPNAVARTRLIERLNRGVHGKLTLISAPAGFGKTTLVSEWIAGNDHPVAWLSLDERDSELKRFLSYLVAALQTISEKVGEKVLELLQSPQLPPPESILTLLINELATIPRPFTLVLDDYHLVDAKTVDDALTFLLEHQPPQMHLIMTTREDPPLPLSRYRVRSQLTEIRASDLRFTLTEAADFLNQAMGLRLSEADIMALETRTEGWIAGLQMAALSLQGKGDTSSFIQDFKGSHHFIIDYLVEEVLLTQPEKVRRFLLQTAILDRLCGPLCDAVTGQEDSERILQNLERSNLFVVPLDDHREWYRYHHLFAEVLTARSAKEQPAELSLLHQRASEWYEQNDAPADAIRHALAAKDFDRAARLIELSWPAMDATFQTSVWLSWLRALPEQVVAVRPVLLVGWAWSLLNNGQLKAAAIQLKKAEALLQRTESQEVVFDDEEQFRFLPSSILTAQAYQAQSVGDIPASVTYARKALDLLPKDDHLRRGPAAALLGLANWSNGNLEAAYQALAEAMKNFQLVGNIVFAVSGTYGLADIRVGQGRLREAVRTYERSLQLVSKIDGPVIPGTADLYLGLGDLYREKNDLEKAIQYISKSEELGEQAALPDWPFRLCLAKGRLKEAQGDLESALAFFKKAEQLYYPTPMPEVRSIPAQQTRILIKQGKLAEARAWVREQGLTTENDLSYLKEYEYLILADLLIAEFRQSGDPRLIKQATDLLDRLLQAAEAGGRTGSIIETLLRHALAREAQGQLAQALTTLERVLTLAIPEGFVRTIADKGKPMINLLVDAAKQGIKPDYIGKLLGESQKEKATLSTTEHSPSIQLLIEPLSDRELEVLQLIAQGLSNREISERLYLALSTIKGHNRNIFDKLEVQRRTEAVARARELGLL